MALPNPPFQLDRKMSSVIIAISTPTPSGHDRTSLSANFQESYCPHLLSTPATKAMSFWSQDFPRDMQEGLLRHCLSTGPSSSRQEYFLTKHLSIGSSHHLTHAAMFNPLVTAPPLRDINTVTVPSLLSLSQGFIEVLPVALHPTFDKWLKRQGCYSRLSGRSWKHSNVTTSKNYLLLPFCSTYALVHVKNCNRVHTKSSKSSEGSQRPDPPDQHRHTMKNTRGFHSALGQFPCDHQYNSDSGGHWFLLGIKLTQDFKDIFPLITWLQ